MTIAKTPQNDNITPVESLMWQYSASTFFEHVYHLLLIHDCSLYLSFFFKVGV